MNKYYLYHKNWVKNNPIAVKKSQEKYTQKINKNFPWLKTLRSIDNRCNKPNNRDYPLYGGRGIKCLITLEELKFILFRDKAYLMKKPSIDRIDNDGNYTLENCQYIEYDINSKKAQILKRKPILQFTKEGIFIREWESICDAVNNIKGHKSSIIACLKLKRKSANGFIWRYK